MSSDNFEHIEIPDINDLNLLSSNSNNSANAVNNHDPLSQPPQQSQLRSNTSYNSHNTASRDRNEALNDNYEEEKPTAEYALHILFTRFVRYTERKLNDLQSSNEDLIELILGEGADPEFDLILESLGHVARRRPKPVIDSIMYWRKTKRDQPTQSLASLYVLCRALMEVIRQAPDDVLGAKLSEKLEEIVFKQLVGVNPDVVASKGIKGANWRYLARLLGEMSSFRLASVDDRFIAELEKKPSSKSHETTSFLLLEALQYLKIKLYPDEFLEESSVFLESLSKFYRKTPFNSPLRSQYALAISQILEPLAESITVEVNQPIWAATMESLYKASQDKAPNSSLASRTASLGSNADPAVSTAFALSVMSLCLSPQPFFSEHWLKLIESNALKYKTKPLKTVRLLPAAAQLTWVYIFRCGESLNLTTKKIETLRKLFLLNTSRKYWQAIGGNKSARKACVSLVRSCFQGYQQYTLDELLFPMLVGTDSTTLAQQHSIAFDSAVSPERAGIAVDIFVEVINDLKNGLRPPFPTHNVDHLVVSPSTLTDGLAGAKESTTKSELPHQPVVSKALQASIDLFGTCVGQIGQWLEQGGVISEMNSRQNSVSHLVSLASGKEGNNTQGTEMQHNERGIKTAEQYLLLLFIRSWPSWWNSEQHLRHLDVLCRCVSHHSAAISDAAAESFHKIAEVCDMKAVLLPFTRSMLAAESRKSNSSSSSGASGGSSSQTTISSPRTDHHSLGLGHHGHSSNFSSGSSSDFGVSRGLGLHSTSASHDFDHTSEQQDHGKEILVTKLKHPYLYVELIEIWAGRLQNGDSAVTGSSSNTKLLNLWAVVEEIEGNGLYFLCSQDMQIRRLGLRVLWLTTVMDQAIINYKVGHQPDKVEANPSRLIDLLQNTPISNIASKLGRRFELSLAEKNRLAKFRSKRATLDRIAESNYGVDSALWLKMFPFIVTLCFERHPIPVALCRNLVSDRLIQMHETVTELSIRPGHSLSELNHVAIIEQWKIYLIVACATLTSTEEQKLYVPDAPSPTVSSGIGTMHSRKRSHQKITLHHQRIISARSVFRIVTPLLKSEKTSVREAIVSGLSCTNVNTYKTLLECLQPVLSVGIQKLNQIQHSQIKTASGVFESFLRSIACVTQILKQTTVFLENKEIRQDVWIRTEIISVLQQLREILGSINSSQTNLLKISFCELLSDAYVALRPSLMFSGRNPAQEWFLFYKTVELWSPYGSNATAVLESRSAMKRRAPNDVVLAQIEIVRRDLDRASSKAISALFLDSQGFFNDLKSAAHWVHALLASNSDSTTQDIGRTALEHLLISHASHTNLLQEVVSRCYHNSSEKSRGVAKVYFVALVNMLESHQDLTKSKVDKPQQFLALALFKIGDPDCETRFRAVRLIEIVENALYGSSVIGNEYQFRLRSSSASVYKREIFVLSGKLAAERGHESFYLFSQMTRAFKAVNDSDRKDILSVLLPWIQNIEFQPNDDIGLQMVLVNLLEITTVFGGRMQHEVEALWVALCTSNSGVNNNALRILDFLLSFCLQHRTVGSVAVSRTVLIYLLASPSSGVITEKLLSYLEPSCMITQASQTAFELISPDCKKEFPYVAALSNIVTLANENEGNHKNVMLPPFSYGQLAVVFLVDTISTATPIVSKLASLIHVCVVLGDHFVALVQDKTRELLLNLAGMFNSDPSGMNKLTDLLGMLRWRYEDDSGFVPDQMKELISVALDHFSNGDILDHREWAQTAIHWATTSPVRHIACRSLQTYRRLGLQLDVKMLGDLLARLSSTISEQALDIQGFATQILMTINHISNKLDKTQLVSYPALFWAPVASLTTANEREYIEALSAVSKLLAKWSPDFSLAIISNFPSRWGCELPDFRGIFPLVTRGLRSENAADLSHTVINQLILMSENCSPNDAMLAFGNQNLLPQMLAASLPWLLHAMDQPHLISLMVTPVQAMQRMVAPYSQGLARVLESFVKRRLWSRSDFLRQYVLALPAAFPDDGVDIMILIMSMVNNATQHIRMAALDILRALIPEANIHQAITPMKWHGADLIAPLLRLLTTPDVEESLSVLDIIASVKPDKMDKDVLRMTLGSRQLFHEYENTETLFGIPDEYGWSVPSPAQAALLTRANVHAVFYSCVPSQISVNGNEKVDSELESNSNLHFQLDEYTPSNSQLYHQNSRQVSTSQLGTESMDKMLTDLDEFDNFFTRVAAPVPKKTPPRISGVTNRAHLYRNSGIIGSRVPNNSSRSSSSIDDITSNPLMPVHSNGTLMRQNVSPVHQRTTTVDSESIPQLYDKKVSLILNRSLARTPSQVSFRASFADSFGRTAHTPLGAGTGSTTHIVSPLASISHSASASLSTFSSRPSHSRQISIQGGPQHNTSFSDTPGTPSIARVISRTSLDSATATIPDSHEYESNFGGFGNSSADFASSAATPANEPYASSDLDSGPNHDYYKHYHHQEANQSPLRDEVESIPIHYSDASPKSETHFQDVKGDGPLANYDFFAANNAETHLKSAKRKSKKSPRTHQDTSFRLESLLRGKKRMSKEKPVVNMNSQLSSDKFQFPPR